MDTLFALRTLGIFHCCLPSIADTVLIVGGGDGVDGMGTGEFGVYGDGVDEVDEDIGEGGGGGDDGDGEPCNAPLTTML